jgi:hypothetical protein
VLTGHVGVSLEDVLIRHHHSNATALDSTAAANKVETKSADDDDKTAAGIKAAEHDWRPAFHFALDLSSALSLLHSEAPVPIVHRNLHPGQCILSSETSMRVRISSQMRLFFLTAARLVSPRLLEPPRSFADPLSMDGG